MTTTHTDYAKAKQALSEAISEIDFDLDEIQFLPQTYTEVTRDNVALSEKFMNIFEDWKDVKAVYHSEENT